MSALGLILWFYVMPLVFCQILAAMLGEGAEDSARTCVVVSLIPLANLIMALYVGATLAVGFVIKAVRR